MKQYAPDTTGIDRTWFARHPHAECYVRMMIPGEFGFFALNGERHVLVTRVALGIRQKHPLKLYAEHGGVPSELLFVDTGERWHVRPSGEVVPKHTTRREAWEALLPEETRELVQLGRQMEGGGS